MCPRHFFKIVIYEDLEADTAYPATAYHVPEP